MKFNILIDIPSKIRIHANTFHLNRIFIQNFI